MTGTAENGLLEVRDPPWWVKRIRFLNKLWYNPVFQRNYGRSRVSAYFTPFRVFLFSLIYSVLACNTVMFINGVGTGLTISVCAILIFSPLVLFYLFALIRMFIACLVTTSAEIQRDIGGESINPMFTTPLGDSDFYFGECMPNLVRGVEFSAFLVTMPLGLIFPFVLIGVAPYIHTELGIYWTIGLVSLSIPLVIIVTFYMAINLLAMMTLISLASGLYSVSFAVVGAVLANLAHYFVVRLISGIAVQIASMFMSGFMFLLLPGFTYGDEILQITLYVLFMIGMGISLELMRLCIIGLGCYITARMGIVAFGRKRREGFWYPYAATGP